MRMGFLSWPSLFIAFGCWVYLLMWPFTTTPSIYFIIVLLWAVMTTMWTTITAPRKNVYNAVRGILLLVLIGGGLLTWLLEGSNIGKWVCIGSAVYYLLILPSSIRDFQGRTEPPLQVNYDKVFANYNRKQQLREVKRIAKAKHKAAVKASEKAKKNAIRRRFEWAAGYYWD